MIFVLVSTIASIAIVISSNILISKMANNTIKKYSQLDDVELKFKNRAVIIKSIVFLLIGSVVSLIIAFRLTVTENELSRYVIISIVTLTVLLFFDISYYFFCVGKLIRKMISKNKS
jgi:hypothetical protein